jgi:glycerate dehydrogenase
MRGVMLDMASLGPEDLDLGPLLGELGDWELHAATAPEAVAARMAGADVVLANKSRIDASALAGAPRLRLIVVMATGTNNVDLAAAAARGIVVCNARNYAADSVAEHTLMSMLALARRLGPHREAVAAGEWSRSEHFCLHHAPIMELRGSRLGIVGYGDLGRAVAALAAAFGMQIALAGLPGRRHAPAPYPRMPFEELLAWCDVLSLHCPLEPGTRGLIGAAELARMRPGALLVNVARGGIVDEGALLEALARGHLGGAAIDTLEVEPPPADALLPAARLPNLIVTPHIAWASRVARQRLVDQLAGVIRAWRDGSPVNVVEGGAAPA